MTENVTSAPPDGRLIDASLFTDRGELRASICDACDTLAFPAQGSCARCPGVELSAISEVALARRGRLWGYTVQRFVPKTPYLGAGRAAAAPYGVGYVELADTGGRATILVESRLVVDDPDDLDRLAVGLDVELCFEALPVGDDADDVGDDDGAVWTFAFAARHADARNDGNGGEMSR